MIGDVGGRDITSRKCLPKESATNVDACYTSLDDPEKYLDSSERMGIRKTSKACHETVRDEAADSVGGKAKAL